MDDAKHDGQSDDWDERSDHKEKKRKRKRKMVILLNHRSCRIVFVVII